MQKYVPWIFFANKNGRGGAAKKENEKSKFERPRTRYIES